MQGCNLWCSAWSNLVYSSMSTKIKPETFVLLAIQSNNLHVRILQPVFRCIFWSFPYRVSESSHTYTTIFLSRATTIIHVLYRALSKCYRTGSTHFQTEAFRERLTNDVCPYQLIPRVNPGYATKRLTSNINFKFRSKRLVYDCRADVLSQIPQSKSLALGYPFYDRLSKCFMSSYHLHLILYFYFFWGIFKFLIVIIISILSLIPNDLQQHIVRALSKITPSFFGLPVIYPKKYPATNKNWCKWCQITISMHPPHCLFPHSTETTPLKGFLSFLPPQFTEAEQQLSMVPCFPEESPVHLGWETVLFTGPGALTGHHQ